MEVRFERPSYSLLREIRELDHQCYNNINIPYKWYKYRYIDLEGILVARIDNRIIGYCSIIGIDRQILNLMKDGMFIDDYSISHKAYKKLYEVDTFYLSSIVVLPEERNKGIGENLLKEAIDNISNYSKEYEIVALAISDSGLKVTEKVGFKRLLCVEDVSIMLFSSKINRILKDRGIN